MVGYRAYLSIYLYIYLSIHLSIYLTISIYLFIRRLGRIKLEYLRRALRVRPTG